MDGIYYWPGIDRFLTFNGVLQELPNEQNLDFFYSNINMTYAQKVYGFKVPRFGEIWWCFPTGSNTECNHAVIYNKREGYWYDTPLPSDGRSAAYFAQTFPRPIMSSAYGLTPIGQNSGVDYPLWLHETGTNQVRGNEVDAIDCFIISPALSLVGGGLSLFGSPSSAPTDTWTTYAFFEQDFIFNQNLILTVLGRMYPQDQDATLDQRTIQKTATENYYDLQVQERYLRWKIEVNEQNGFFVMGQPLIAFKEGDKSR